MCNRRQAASAGRGSYQTSSQNLVTTADSILINRLIYFSSGQFAGEIMRYELTEIQKASLGRKLIFLFSDRSFYPNDRYVFRPCRYARVDRRPLDPPLVVLLHIWRYSPETGKEEEVDYE